MKAIKIERRGIIFYAQFEEWLVEEFLKVLDAVNDIQLREGMTVQLGFTLYQFVHMTESTYRVLTLCFDKAETSSFTQDLTLALTIQKAQLTFCQLLQALPLDTRYDDRVIISKGVLESDSYYLQRQAVESSDDSGWFIGYQDENNEELLSVPAIVVAFSNPHLIKCLMLPTDYLVVVKKGEVVAVLDDKDRVVYESKEPTLF